MIEFICDTKTEIKNGKKKNYGLYRCFCGNEFESLKTLINTNRKKDCGCTKKETHKKAHTKHGMHNSRIYKIRQQIIQRCTNINATSFERYGGRGITICKEWKDDFKAFYEWAILNGYEDNLTIDRIDNNGNYEPNNCRWSTKTTQARNTIVLQSNNTSGFRGVCWNKSSRKWQSGITIKGKYIFIGLFDDIVDGAKAYNKYVINNNLEHTKNNIL